MECSCVYAEGELGEILFEKVVKARKEHRCGECRRTIQPGEKYEKVIGKWVSNLETYKTCTDCLSIRNSFFCDGWIYTQLLGDLHDYIDASGGQVSSDCIVDLTPDAQDTVFEMIERAWRRIDTQIQEEV